MPHGQIFRHNTNTFWNVDKYISKFKEICTCYEILTYFKSDGSASNVNNLGRLQVAKCHTDKYLYTTQIHFEM